MLDKFKVINSLEAKKNEFISCKESCSDEYRELKNNLDSLFSVSSPEIIKDVKSKTDTPGALPTIEWDSEQFIHPFNEQFQNHPEARKWAYNTLLDRITFAVDGSQILPSKDFNPPVGAVQVAMFENYHSSDGLYIKDIDFEVISSMELFDKAAKTISREHYINYKRFELEVNTLINYIETSKENNLKPVVFFDGSLIVTFITAEGATSGNELYRNYIEKACELLDVAEVSKIPLISYIDSSGAHDLVDMIKSYFDIKGTYNINDTEIVNADLQWGDRTPVFKCDRPGVLKQYREHKDKICFTYLKTNKGYPSRLEFPLWLFENRDLFEKTLNIVRAEIIIGNGYIYSIESADASAVISNNDRRQFYKIFSDFAYKNDLQVSVSQKSVSKTKRRY